MKDLSYVFDSPVGASGAMFGSAVDVDATRAVIGAYGFGNSSLPGSAYVYDRDTANGDWTTSSALVPSDGLPGDGFGWSVAVSGDRVVVGAPYRDSAGVDRVGKVYMYERGSNGWTQTLTIANPVDKDDRFGERVALDGNRLLISAPAHDWDVVGLQNGFDRGAVYAYELRDGSWVQTSKFTSPNLGWNGLFGRSLSLDGDRVAVGGPVHDDGAENAGVVSIFSRNTTTGVWTRDTDLASPNVNYNDQFGDAVALSGNTLLVSSRNGDTTRGIDTGAVYVFERNASTNAWTRTGSLLDDAAQPGDMWGVVLGLADNGKHAVVGNAAQHTYSDYEKFTGNPSFVRTQKITQTTDSGPIAVTPSGFLLGSPSFNGPQAVSGRAIMFDNETDGDGIPAPPDNCPKVHNPNQADSDGDGVGNVCDGPDLALRSSVPANLIDMHSSPLTFTAKNEGTENASPTNFLFQVTKQSTLIAGIVAPTGWDCPIYSGPISTTETVSYIYCTRLNGALIAPGASIEFTVRLVPTGTAPVTFVAQVSSGSDVNYNNNSQVRTMNVAPYDDEDGDALPDEWENAAVDLDANGTPEFDLRDLGVLETRPDVILEVDHMVCTNTAVCGTAHDDAPTASALSDVATAYADHGITLHAVTDDADAIEEIPTIHFGYDPTETHTSSPDGFWSWSDTVEDSMGDLRWGKVAYTNPCDGYIGTAAMRATTGTNDCRLSIEAWRRASRYVVFGHNLYTGDPNQKLGGIAEFNGDDEFISVGGWTPDTFTTISRAEGEARVFMHETGHVMGLTHAGGIDQILTNCAPNYMSIMNYVYAYRVVATDAPLDYSVGDFATINEATLNESLVLHPTSNRKVVYSGPNPGDGSHPLAVSPPLNTTGGRVDWNSDGDLADDASHMDVNRNDRFKIDGPYSIFGCGNATPDQELRDHDDWHNLDFNWRDNDFFLSAPGMASETPATSDREFTINSVLAAADELDADGDGVSNLHDNCIDEPNADQANVDADRLGDACDAPAATTLTANPAVLQLSGPTLPLLKLKATLRVTATNAPIAGQRLTFLAGTTTLCNATTNASGAATCDATPTAKALAVIQATGYRVTFVADRPFASASASGALAG